MTKARFLIAAALLAATTLAPTLADARHYRHHRHHWLPYKISYVHNYGPGPVPGTFVYYDGSAYNHCYQSAAAYIGQNGRRHPCY